MRPTKKTTKLVTAAALAVSALAAAAAAMGLFGGGNSEPKQAPPAARPAARAPRTDAIGGDAGTAASEAVRAPRTAEPVARGAAAEVAAALDALAKLYAHSGQLDWDAARARAQEQEAGRKALVERLAALGPGGAEELARRYRETASVREKLLLAEALGRSVGGEAAGEIQALLEDEDVYSLRRELAVALGRRKEPEAAAAVAELIASEGDARIRVALVHTLTGAESGSALLARMAASDPTPEVRIEALAALGRSPGQAGAAAVAQAAQAADQPESVRVAAAQELARSFPDESVAALRSILEGEDDVKLRVSAVKALKRLQSAEAQALLSETAASDPSATVRQHARVALLGAENAGERR